jgi:hypothetical protein
MLNDVEVRNSISSKSQRGLQVRKTLALIWTPIWLGKVSQRI